MKTKNILKGLAIGVISCSTVLSLAGCNNVVIRDPEIYPVTLAIGALDGNYNPFFYTAQNDGEVTSLTQISLITSDRDTNITCGQDEPTVALAYRETVAPDSSYTTYEYVIKNGIKFSDGEDLTIKDVLFNFYVYLDPYYSGSSTLYSTKIKGLAEYRTQDPNASEDADATSQFLTDGSTRLDNLRAWDNDEQEVTPQIEEDAVTVANLFMKYLESAWNTSYGAAGSYSESYNFTEDWEVFYFITGLAEIQVDYVDATRRERLKDENGKYVMNFDKYDFNGDPSDGKEKEGTRYILRKNMEDALEGLTGDARQAAMKEEAIDTAFKQYFSVTYDENGKMSVDGGYGSICDALDLYVGSDALQAFTNDAMSKAADKLREENQGELLVKSISGIVADKVTAKDFGSDFTGSPLNPDESYDRLTITVNGIDPVAKYNFGITIAPMHYYSGTVDGVDYVARANENWNNDKISDRFGVKYKNKTFFDEVMKDGGTNKSAKPVGAGSYKMRNERLEINHDCQYERNTYFATVGTGLHNANIKYLTYRYISDDQVATMLSKGDIDFGTPNCTTKNIDTLNSANNLIAFNQYDANGFGYVGINPKFVPDIEIRRIIMSVMDIADITATYYDGKYAQVIYRPITTNTWVYDENNKETKPYYDYVTEQSKIEAALVEAGYGNIGQDGVRYNGNKKLKYTFTIAGETQDHPAFSMFKKAEAILNECGFDITVQTDIDALSKLAMGNLQVWAAAWTSGVDPDMYQVYHKDSKASSVRNWGYDVILANPKEYDTEYKILVGKTVQEQKESLSALIDEARSVSAREKRAPIYRQALDLVMELAVELPTYQRKDLYAYNKTVLDGSSMTANPNANDTPLSRIWELSYYK